MGVLSRDPRAAREPRPEREEAAFVAAGIGDDSLASELDASFSLAGRLRAGRVPLPRELYGAPAGWLADPLQAWLDGPEGLAGNRRNGAALADTLDRNPADGDQAYLVAGLADAATRGELSRWLRYGGFEHRNRTRLGRLAELEMLRLFAVAIHDDEQAAYLEAIVARHRRAVLHREILVPLAILEDMVLREDAPADISR